MIAVLDKTKITLEMIKWEHSIFALPFALTGAVLLMAIPCVRQKGARGECWTFG